MQALVFDEDSLDCGCKDLVKDGREGYVPGWASVFQPWLCNDHKAYGFTIRKDVSKKHLLNKVVKLQQHHTNRLK